jgi:hypothetical protein
MLILDSQAGIVSLPQALALGWSLDEIRWKHKRGHWQRVHQGVYATFSGPLPRKSRLWAVVLRCGSNATLSHQTAAELHGFALPAAEDDTIHVAVPAGSNPNRKGDLRGVTVHRTARLHVEPHPDWTLPRTPVDATVLDLVASAATLDDAYAWVSRAVTRRLVTVNRIREALAGRPKMPRRGWLSEALTDVSDGAHFPLELRWKRDVERAHGFPAATRQAKRKGADGIRFLDNLYEPWNLCVELDGAIFHLGEDKVKDRFRDNETMIVSGIKTLRYGFPEIANRPCVHAAQFARALLSHGWPAGTLKPCQPGCPVATIARRPPSATGTPHQAHGK